MIEFVSQYSVLLGWMVINNLNVLLKWKAAYYVAYA